jgi:hypothetical protein
MVALWSIQYSDKYHSAEGPSVCRAPEHIYAAVAQLLEDAMCGKQIHQARVQVDRAFVIQATAAQAELLRLMMAAGSLLQQHDARHSQRPKL